MLSPTYKLVVAFNEAHIQALQYSNSSQYKSFVVVMYSESIASPLVSHHKIIVDKHLNFFSMYLYDACIMASLIVLLRKLTHLEPNHGHWYVVNAAVKLLGMAIPLI